MRRRARSSSDPLTDLIAVFIDLPWWASLIGALVAFLVLGLLVPAIAGAGTGGIVTAGVMRVLGPIVAGLILVAGAIGALTAG
jgi:ABC-type transporter Mla maintaining outer membrane lipid asymmetry permease subunit MlaE